MIYLKINGITYVRIVYVFFVKILFNLGKYIFAMPLKNLLCLLVDCSKNVHVNKITFTPMKKSPKVPDWNIDVNKGPWIVDTEDSSYSNYITYQLSF